MSTYDPETYARPDARPFATEAATVPPGEYRAFIDKAFVETISSDKGTWRKVTVTWSCADNELMAKLDRTAPPTVRQGFLLDMEDGKLKDKGDANWRLGQILAAAGFNDPADEHYQSVVALCEHGGEMSVEIGDLAGVGPCLIRVGTRKDKNKPGVEYTDVNRVVAIKN